LDRVMDKYDHARDTFVLPMESYNPRKGKDRTFVSGNGKCYARHHGTTVWSPLWSAVQKFLAGQK
jgi:hypothetical protein